MYSDYDYKQYSIVFYCTRCKFNNCTALHMMCCGIFVLPYDAIDVYDDVLDYSVVLYPVQ